MIGLLILVVMIGLAALLGGYAGALHPAGDSLAAFRPVLAGVVLALSLPIAIWGPRGFALLAVALALAALAHPAWLRVVPRAAGGVAVYSKNLFHGNDDVAGLVWEIDAMRPDLVLLQEVTAANEAVLDLLSASYPTRHRCADRPIGDTAVLSRWPAIEGTAHCAHGAAIVRVAAPEGPLWVVSLHLRWPWPRAQAAHAAAIEEALAELDGPAVVGGDFNMLPWGHSVQRLADAVGGAPVRPAPGTRTLAGVLPLAIDHVIATGRRPGVSQRRPPIGSDHHGVLARVSPFGDA